MYFPRFVGLYIFEQFAPVFRSAPLTIVASTVASTARCGTMSRPNETRLVRLHKGMLASAKLGIRLAGDDRPRIVYLDPEAIGARTVGLAVDDVILSVNGETARGHLATTKMLKNAAGWIKIELCTPNAGGEVTEADIAKQVDASAPRTSFSFEYSLFASTAGPTAAETAAKRAKKLSKKKAKREQAKSGMGAAANDPLRRVEGGRSRLFEAKEMDAARLAKDVETRAQVETVDVEMLQQMMEQRLQTSINDRVEERANSAPSILHGLQKSPHKAFSAEAAPRAQPLYAPHQHPSQHQQWQSHPPPHSLHPWPPPHMLQPPSMMAPPPPWLGYTMPPLQPGYLAVFTPPQPSSYCAPAHAHVPRSRDPTAASLAIMTLGEQREVLGETLFPLVLARVGERAGKVTGMLLQLADPGALLAMIQGPPPLLVLDEAVAEATRKLEGHAA